MIRTLGQPSGFSGVGKMLGTFRDTESYTPTFELLEMPKPVEDKAQVVENAKNFNKLTTSPGLHVYDVFNHFTHWYYFEESDIFAPSKFIGYENTTVENYKGQGRDGRITEKVLQNWFKPLEPEAPHFEELSEKLREFASNLGRHLKKNYRIHVEQTFARMEQQYPLNQILYGPPGTGKTWHTVNLAVAIIDDKSEVDDYENKDRKKITGRFDELKQTGQIEMVTFHQNYAYEDFIEGIRPVLSEKQGPGNKEQGDKSDIKYELSSGVFKKISMEAQGAQNNGNKRYVLIIDEINRGNIAKIFGELITLIEESKRLGNDDGATTTLPYSKKSFSIPKNLYIIGTMNTADRSIALLDTALRRRFDFVEMMPDPKHSGISKDIQGVNCQELLEKINERIRILHDRDHQIGHTYFLDVKDLDSLAKAFKNRIIPLLQEYFYENWEKIDLVLNRNGFIKGSGVDESLLRNSGLVESERKIYELLTSSDGKWQDSDSYKKIYQAETPPPKEDQVNSPA